MLYLVINGTEVSPSVTTLISIVQRLPCDFISSKVFFLIWPFIPSHSNTNFQVSDNQRDESSAHEGEESDTHTKEQDGVSVEDGGIKTDNTNQMEEDSKDKENKENDEDEEEQRQEETEEHVNKNDNGDAQDDRKEAVVNEEAVFGAFLQVSEPALVSSHHDGFLRFWNLSVSL